MSSAASASRRPPPPVRLRRLDTSQAKVPLLGDSHNNMGNEEEDKSPVSPTSTVDSEDEGSPFEKKCILINKEIDSNGMGRYQWYIWTLCGFGYFLDLLWAQAFGLVLGPLGQELGFGGGESGNISVAFSSGLTAGAFIWGVLVDIIGRKWAFNLTCLFSAVFGLGLGGCNSYTAFLVVTAFVGFGIGGNIPIDTTICLEFIPQNRRFLLALLSIFQPIGVVITTVLAYAYIPSYSCTPDFSQGDDALKSCKLVPAGQPCCSKADNMGWRYLMFTLGAITMAVLIARSVVFNFQESPKFLVYRGQDKKAIRALEHIAKVNNRACGVTLADFEALNDPRKEDEDDVSWQNQFYSELVRYKALFHTPQVSRLTILIWLTYAFDFWGFTLAGTYLPEILAVKNASIDLTLRQTYRNYIAIYTPGVVGVVSGAMMYRVPIIGRKLAMMFSAAMMGTSIFIFSSVNTQASNIGLNVMEYFFQSMLNAVLYGWTPEVFAAPIRGTACGIAAFWGRLFSILAPLTAQSVIPEGGFTADDPSINSVLYLAGGLTLGCVLTVGLLPNKMIGQQSL